MFTVISHLPDFVHFIFVIGAVVVGMVTVGPLVTAAGMAAGGSVAASKDRNQHSEGKVKLAGVEANFKGSPYLIVALFGFLLAAAFYLDLI